MLSPKEWHIGARDNNDNLNLGILMFFNSLTLFCIDVDDKSMNETIELGQQSSTIMDSGSVCDLALKEEFILNLG